METEITHSSILNARGLLTIEQVWNFRVLPVQNGQTTIMYSDETKLPDRDELEFILDTHIDFRTCEKDLLENYLRTYYPQSVESPNIANKYLGVSEDFLKDLISEAKDLNSSDIHMEIYDEKCRVRVRMDGRLTERYILEKNDYPSIINKIKILSNLDIAEKRLPQDGRIHHKTKQSGFDIRVSTLPTLHGEKIVLRLLNNDAANIDIFKLGFAENDLANYLESISRPNGIVLISGPTGSGKTTTLYASLKYLNRQTHNIVTVEDPIEYTLEGINQVQLKENIGLTFPIALRTFLRQDPDIIMVGEIRDVDTAAMAIRASLTGHLVLSTIHTNSAWGTVSRLIDMGIPPFLVANTLNASIAQRLVRVLCTRCKLGKAFDEGLYPRKFKPYHQIQYHYVATGCSECQNTGYVGRKAIYEIIPIDAGLGEKIKNNSLDVERELKLRDVKLLAENAFELFSQGDTTIEEIYPLLFNY